MVREKIQPQVDAMLIRLGVPARHRDSSGAGAGDGGEEEETLCEAAEEGAEGEGAPLDSSATQSCSVRTLHKDIQWSSIFHRGHRMTMRTLD